MLAVNKRERIFVGAWFSPVKYIPDRFQVATIKPIYLRRIDIVDGDILILLRRKNDMIICFSYQLSCKKSAGVQRRVNHLIFIGSFNAVRKGGIALNMKLTSKVE
ncbi:hypothetical protein B4923_17830 [Brenneria roseae subsp. americana]|uniref:Uncharacterized protein n=1 Tax=Brenneria roseae subsp. americana TaxID=1508507 RepID=A0A2U1TKS3_9GAMM|nr:hypothetical protein B4923_17830 [Brenneria roseae subsp. americana]